MDILVLSLGLMDIEISLTKHGTTIMASSVGEGWRTVQYESPIVGLEATKKWGNMREARRRGW